MSYLLELAAARREAGEPMRRPPCRPYPVEEEIMGLAWLEEKELEELHEWRLAQQRDEPAQARRRILAKIAMRKLPPLPCVLWFESYQDAKRYAKNAGIAQEPAKRPVWADMQQCEIWSLLVFTGRK